MAMWTQTHDRIQVNKRVNNKIRIKLAETTCVVYVTICLCSLDIRTCKQRVCTMKNDDEKSEKRYETTIAMMYGDNDIIRY